MKKILLITIVILTSCSFSVYSQIFTTKQDSIIKEKINRLIKDYEFFGTLTENDMDISQQMVLKFKNLFKDDAYIYNDLVKSEKKMLPLKEYIRMLTQNFPSGISLNVEITKIGKPNTAKNSFYYNIPINIEKNIVTIDKNGKLIKLNGLENTVDVSFSKNLTDFKIQRIREKQIEYSTIILTFIDIDRSEPVKDVEVNLEHNGEILQTKVSNNNGKVVFNRVNPELRVKILIDPKQGYSSEEIPEMKAAEWANADKAKRTIFLKRYKQWQKMSFEIFGSMAFTSLSTDLIQNNFSVDSYNIDMSTEFNGGINYTYYFKTKEKNAMGIGLGVHFDSYSSDLYIKHYTQNDINNKVDVDHDTYSLLVSANDVNDKLKVSYFGIPVYFKYRIMIENPLVNFVYFNAGIKLSFLAYGTSTLSGKISYAGYYPEWDITIEDIDDLNYYNDKEFNFKSDLEIKSLMLSSIAGAGISIALKKPYLNLIAGVDLNYSLSNLSNYNSSNYYLSSEQKEYNTFAGASNTIRPFSYGFHIGVLYDLFK